MPMTEWQREEVGVGQGDARLRELEKEGAVGYVNAHRGHYWEGDIVHYVLPVSRGEHGYEYIYINWAGTSKSGKTNVYTVHNLNSGDVLGVVKWFGRWRQYAFFPEPGTLYSMGCCEDIADFIRQCMLERRA